MEIYLVKRFNSDQQITRTQIESLEMNPAAVTHIKCTCKSIYRYPTSYKLTAKISTGHVSGPMVISTGALVSPCQPNRVNQVAIPVSMPAHM